MHPFELEPLLPDAATPGLADLALEFEREAAALGGALHADVVACLIDILRIANSYYSNRIEGNDTTPAGVEAAMRRDWASDPRRREMQVYAVAHVEVERVADAWLDADPTWNPSSPAALSALHREFYERVDEADRWVALKDHTRRKPIVPGAWRDFDVEVGRHVAPPHASVAACLARTAEGYAPERLHGLERTLAFAASHHRWLWAHPFGDGNGRVMRLASRLYARRLGIGGAGLWTPARGLARNRDRYMAALAEADLPRRNDLDGRGARSHEGLVAFTRFFLTTCLDQVRYMRDVLALDRLENRLLDYVDRRTAGVLPRTRDPLPDGSRAVLRHCLHSGRVARGELMAITGRSRRSVTSLIAALLRDGLLLSDSHRDAVRLGLPLHALRYLLPDLYPEGADEWEPTAPATTSP